MRVSRIGAAAAIVGLLLGGFAVGRAANEMIQAETVPNPSPSPMDVTGGEILLPTIDAEGDDFATLPRYPGSVRTQYVAERRGPFRTVDQEYLVAAPLDEVRAFYRAAFHNHGWVVADLGFEFGEWVYVLVDGQREAVVELEARGSVTEIELELSEPVEGVPDPSPTPVAPTPVQPAPPPAPPAPPPGGGDDDDDDDDDFDTDDDGSGVSGDT